MCVCFSQKTTIGRRGETHELVPRPTNSPLPLYRIIPPYEAPSPSLHILEILDRRSLTFETCRAEESSDGDDRTSVDSDPPGTANELAAQGLPPVMGNGVGYEFYLAMTDAEDVVGGELGEEGGWVPTGRVGRAEVAKPPDRSVLLRCDDTSDSEDSLLLTEVGEVDLDLWKVLVPGVVVDVRPADGIDPLLLDGGEVVEVLEERLDSSSDRRPALGQLLDVGTDETTSGVPRLSMLVLNPALLNSR
jgi:hypothetical protein